MLTDRRRLIKKALLLSIANASSSFAWSEAIKLAGKSLTTNLYASAFTDQSGHHHLALFNQTGEVLWQQPLAERAHAPVFHPSLAIAGIVARRPGFYLELYDIPSGKSMMSFTPTQDHHFYGHSLFSADGKLLVTSENHYPSGQGKIFIRDWQKQLVVGQFSSYGIGPHEIHFLNENTLVVANGGLQTHPEQGRRILNLETMNPNVAFIEFPSGKLLNKLELPEEWKQLSIRHMDINQQGEVVLGFQYQGHAFDEVPLVGYASLNSTAITMLDFPPMIRQRFKQYCGSVTMDKSGSLLAVSSPRGGIVAYWNMSTKTYLGHNNYRDVCGIAPTAIPHQFLLTTGKGKRVLVNPIEGSKQQLAALANFQWDNHIHHQPV